MKINSTLYITLALFLVGTVLSFVFWGQESGLWFSVGSGLTLINFYFATWVVHFGLKSLRNKGLFVALLLIKTTAFLSVIGMVLVLVKPILLPFTLGISVVIVGATVGALWESRRLLGKNN